MRARSALAEARTDPKDDKLVEAFGAIHNRLGSGSIHLKAGGESPEPSIETGILQSDSAIK